MIPAKKKLIGRTRICPKWISEALRPGWERVWSELHSLEEYGSWGTAMPSVSFLSEATGLSVSVVRRSLRQLEKLGALQTLHRKGRPSEYVTHSDAPRQIRLGFDESTPVKSTAPPVKSTAKASYSEASLSPIGEGASAPNDSKRPSREEYGVVYGSFANASARVLGKRRKATPADERDVTRAIKLGVFQEETIETATKKFDRILSWLQESGMETSLRACVNNWDRETGTKFIGAIAEPTPTPEWMEKAIAEERSLAEKNGR